MTTSDGYECNNWWSLSVFPAPGQDLRGNPISRVTYTLHETYKYPVRVLNSPPFLLECTAWGWFDVEVKVELSQVYGNSQQKQKELITFPLSFSGPTKTQNFELMIDESWQKPRQELHKRSDARRRWK